MALKRSIEEYIESGPFSLSPLQLFPMQDGQTDFTIPIELDYPESSFLVINGEVFPYNQGYSIESNILYLNESMIFNIATDDTVVLYI